MERLLTSLRDIGSTWGDGTEEAGEDKGEEGAELEESSLIAII